MMYRIPGVLSADEVRDLVAQLNQRNGSTAERPSGRRVPR